LPQERQAQLLRFGVFEVSLAARELRKHGIRVRLPGQPFALLTMLLEKPGEVVTREEMRQRLWPSDTFVDFEHGLNSAIKKLRAALNDTPENSRYVETLPRLGYRFVAPVEDISAVPEVPVAPVAVAPAQASRSPRRWLVPLGISALLIAMATGYFVLSRARPHQRPSGQRWMLAVLPFENLTGDAGQEYFSDGLTEEMISQLGRLDPQHLGVIARTSVMHYKHSPQQLGQIGRELGVQYVLEGSVRRDSSKVRITAELIQMRDQTRVWARQYDRDLTGLLALQGEIAQETADEIQLTLGDKSRPGATDRKPTAPPSSYEAYDLYLKGRYFWNKRTQEGFEQAAASFQQAIAIAPNYARPYAGLADSYALMSSYDFVSQNEFMPKARMAALRALQIDDSLAEAHTSLALIAQNYDWDWQTAEKEYLRAIQLDPNYATAHHWYAESLGFQGRFDEAFPEMERARQLDPLSLIIAADNGAILYFSHQYDRAIEQFRAVLAMEPDFTRANEVLFVYAQKGMYAELLDYTRQRRWTEDNPWCWAIKVYIYGRSHKLAEARSALTRLEQLNRRRQADPLTFVTAYIGMDNKDKAFAWLQKAYLQHSGSMPAIKVDPVYDPLRGDPRFQELLRRLHFAASGSNAASTSKP
jgi:TolB-like protein/DNA-binding winged helix-turn-helix (wHTH) protein/Tfp pilus assembly protein PilF